MLLTLSVFNRKVGVWVFFVVIVVCLFLLNYYKFILQQESVQYQCSM